MLMMKRRSKMECMRGCDGEGCGVPLGVFLPNGMNNARIQMFWSNRNTF